MEQKNNNQVSTFLMVVGICFIVVAGSIFASKAWQYVPDIAKQMVLAGVAIGSYIGAKKLELNGTMHKTSAALYYLGTAFLGLFVMLLFGGMWMEDGNQRVTGWNEISFILSGLCMLLATAWRFAEKRTTFDFVLTALLADWVIMWIKMLADISVEASALLSAAGILVYTMAYRNLHTWSWEKQGVECAFHVLYILHGVSFVFHLLLASAFMDGTMARLAMAVMTGTIVFITYTFYEVKEIKVFRYLNSIAVLWFVQSCVTLCGSLLKDTGLADIKLLDWFCFFTASYVIGLVTKRKEIIISMLVFGFIMPFVQVSITFDYHLLSATTHRETAYLPFTLVLMAGMVYLLWQAMDSRILETRECIRYIIVIAIQSVPMLVAWHASRTFVDGRVYLILTTVSLLTCDLLCSHELVRVMLHILNIIMSVITAGSYTLEWIPDDYKREWVCLLLLITILLFERMGEEIKNEMRGFKFVSITLMMVFLLLSGAIAGGIGNALILGAVGVVILVLASVYNNRAYAIMSSVVLLLLALYITRDFWFQIAWWIYLMIAGVVLVVIAVKKERGE